MSHQTFFPSRLPLPSRHLPLTLISLEDWVLLTFDGVDSTRYLQNQLTCDVVALPYDRFSFAAHCNAQGKMFSNLCVFHRKQGMALIERRSVCNHQLTELKKYAVFSKTTIVVDNEVILLGVAGFKAQSTLKNFFSNLSTAIYSTTHYQNTTVLFFNLPSPRYLLITTSTVCNALQHKLKREIQLNNSQQWLALDIEAGYPIIDKANSLRFIPQAANVQALNGISFNKGCYSGQEVIARTKYRGTNRRALYWLAGKASYLPAVGESLELKLANSWRKTGTVLASCYMANNSVWIQSILNKNIPANSHLRVAGDDVGKLVIYPLPYIIDE